MNWSCGHKRRHCSAFASALLRLYAFIGNTHANTTHNTHRRPIIGWYIYLSFRWSCRVLLWCHLVNQLENVIIIKSITVSISFSFVVHFFSTNGKNSMVLHVVMQHGHVGMAVFSSKGKIRKWNNKKPMTICRLYMFSSSPSLFLCETSAAAVIYPFG